ncbi:MAG TPA: NAD(P)/FAD-dependent oxidoreductase, partial [Chroococcales cyanobacterium]
MSGSVTRTKFQRQKYDAVVVGSGPNGLTAAIILLQRGMSVLVIEGQSTAGGGCRSAQLTLPGFTHDICSAVHPLGIGSPIFRTLPLSEHGLVWIHPQAPYAHPFDDGTAVVVKRSIEETAAQLGPDAERYKFLMKGLVPENWDSVCEILRRPIELVRHPFAMAGFGLSAIQSTTSFCNLNFRNTYARGMFAGVAAHSALKMEDFASASFGVVLGLAAHAVGWPIPRGGTQMLADALISYMVSLGGELATDAPVASLSDLPESKIVLFDL